jgi:FKBP-type peptidyl-prolyl cis-trans isomerase FklB
MTYQLSQAFMNRNLPAPARFNTRLPKLALARIVGLTLLSGSCGAALALDAAQTAPAAPASVEAAASGAPLTSIKDKMSYATGVTTARQLMKNEVPFDADLIIQGLRDGMSGGQIRMGEKELRLVLQSMQADIVRKMASDRSVKASLARENGRIFQEDYKKKPGVTVLPGNLMYRVITEGTGEKPGELGTVVVKYRGTLIDGTEFDATPEGKTTTLKLTEVITGWREALKRMPAGSVWEVVIPPALAYATRGAGSIGPNETLVFTLEHVAVVQ